MYDADAMVKLVGDVMSNRADELNPRSPSAELGQKHPLRAADASAPAASHAASHAASPIATAAVGGRPRSARAFGSSGDDGGGEPMSAPQVQSLISNAKNRGHDATSYAAERGAHPYVAYVRS